MPPCASSQGRGTRTTKGHDMAMEMWDWFIELVDKGTITRAADELQIPQQTLSARLAALEKELGCKLVVRTTPLALTRAGEVFLAYAQEQSTANRQMMRRLSDVTIGGSGRLKVGISNMRGRVLMPHVLEEFHRSLPGVSVKLIEGTNEELLRLAERNEADVVVAIFDGAHPGAVTRALYAEEVVLAADASLLERVCGLSVDEVVRRAEAEGLGVLGACPFLLETVDDISGQVSRMELTRAKIKTEGLVESENMMTLLALAAAGLGAVFCPTNMLDAMSVVTKDLVRIRLSERATYTVSTGTPVGADPWIATELFCDILGALFGTTAPEEPRT